MEAPVIACMGGWCAHRNSCGHYQAEDRRDPAENLCRDEGGSQWMPVRVLHQEHEHKEAA